MFEIKQLDMNDTDTTEIFGIAAIDKIEEWLKGIVPEDYYTKYGEDVVPAVVLGAYIYLMKPKKGEMFADAMRGAFKASAGRVIGTRIIK